MMKSNHAYEFSLDVPFLLRKGGTWEYKEDGEMGFAILSVTNSKNICDI